MPHTHSLRCTHAHAHMHVYTCTVHTHSCAHAHMQVHTLTPAHTHVRAHSYAHLLTCTHSLLTGLRVPGPPGLTCDLAIHWRRHAGQCRLKLNVSLSEPQASIYVLMQEFGVSWVHVIVANKADDKRIATRWGTRRTDGKKQQQSQRRPNSPAAGTSPRPPRKQ